MNTVLAETVQRMLSARYTDGMEFTERRIYYQRFWMLSDEARARIFIAFGREPISDPHLEGRTIMAMLAGPKAMAVASRIDMIYKLEQEERDLVSIGQRKMGHA